MTRAAHSFSQTCCLALVLLFGAAQSEEAAPPMSPFGIGSCHTNNTGAPANQRWVPQIAKLGITVHRTVHTSWGAVEPEEGKFNFENIDKQMAYLDEQKIQYGGILIGNPKWNNKNDKPGYLPVNNIAGWSKYVGEVVKHAKGKIKYWEIWNEPPNGTGKDQTAADYAKLVSAAYDAAHAADPDCKIGIAAKSVAINYLDQALVAGAKGHFDYVTLHPYEVAGCTITTPGSEVVYLQIVPTLRKMLAARDPAKVNCPLILTEIGFAAGGQWGSKIPGYTQPDVQAHALVKYYTMGIAQGMTCIQWFEGMDGDSGPMGLIMGNGTLRPAYHALGNMVKYFGQHPAYLGWVLLNDKHYAFVFQGANGPVMATWAASFTNDKIDFGAPVKIVNPLTSEVTTADKTELSIAPIILDGVPDALLQKAKSNKDKPFPWDGNYGDAKSVSVTYGEKNVEKGLHTKSSESIAKDVLAYGGGSRHGSVPGGNVFMVDPYFLTYTSTPIEISVVCRRNEANEPAKLSLKYESTTGYKNAEPYEIPDNKEWHTAKWKIEDSQFVSMWAYNFTLNSGKYAIQSVTVTKLEK